MRATFTILMLCAVLATAAEARTGQPRPRDRGQGRETDSGPSVPGCQFEPVGHTGQEQGQGAGPVALGQAARQHEQRMSAGQPAFPEEHNLSQQIFGFLPVPQETFDAGETDLGDQHLLFELDREIAADLARPVAAPGPEVDAEFEASANLRAARLSLVENRVLWRHGL